MAEKTVNYTNEQTAELVSAYVAGEAVEKIAERMGKSVRSIVAKLSREGVYKAKSAAKSAHRVTKAEMVAEIEKRIGAEAGTLESMEKAEKAALELVLAFVIPATETEVA